MWSKTEEPEETLEWKDTIGRKYKGGVVKIIIKLRIETRPPIETPQQPFCDRMQELLRSGKVIVACDA